MKAMAHTLAPNVARHLCLCRGEIHVWSTCLDGTEEDAQEAGQLLSLDEQARAQRFYFEQDRRRFMLGRGFLRQVLGHYLEIAPQQVSFCYQAHGKPAVVQTYHGRALAFNASHSGSLFLCAISLERPLGIDVEQVRPLATVEHMVKRLFTPGEQAACYELPPEERLHAFYRGWTAKEAYLKALGVGLTRPLNTLEVSLAPDTSAKLLSVAGEQEAWIRWSLRTLLGGPAYVATLATEGTDYRLVAQPCSHSPEECTCLVELLTHCTPMPDTVFL